MTQPLIDCHCGRRHRTWYAVARCTFPRAIWIAGNPPLAGPCYASVSDCRCQTVILHPAHAQAMAAKERIDATGCGGGCCRRHRIVEL